jgi:hypothetical protein
LASGFLRHRENVLTGELADELGVVAVDVVGDVSDEFVIVIAADDLAAFAVDELGHLDSFQ